MIPKVQGAIAAAAICALFAALKTTAFTLPGEIDKLLAFKALMEKRGPHWKGNLANWTCPTPAETSDGECDPCGKMMWWGNWPYVGCRGFSIRGEDQLGGNGYVTDLHFTNLVVEGPDLPVQEVCDTGLTHLKELDINGNHNATPPMSGPIPQVYGQCFPLLSTSKLSFNQLTGRIPVIVANNTRQQHFKIRSNKLTGPIPPEIGAMPILYYLDMSLNQLNGTIPETFRKSNTMSLMTLANNNFTGNLYNMPQNLMLVETANNLGLCGMVPASVRWAHGFNPSRTNLGKPCPGEKYPIDFPPGF